MFSEKYQSFRDRQLPANPSDVPAEVRLVRILPDIENIVARTAEEQSLRQHNERVVRDALQYTPPFAQEIVEDLRSVRILLIENGFRPARTPRDEVDTALDEKIAETLKEYTFRPKATDPAATAKDVARKISKVLHPDVAGQDVSKVFTAAEIDETYTEALKVSRAENAEKAQQVLIETMPRLYLYRLRHMLTEGMTYAEIVAQNPELLPELEQLRWVAMNVLPKEHTYRRFSRPEEADKEAARLKRKNEHHARTIGYSMVCGLTEEVFEFAKSRGINPNQGVTNEFDRILKFMEDVRGYVGGTGEFSYQRGDWVVTPYGATLATRMEGFIKALPDGLHYLTTVIVNPDSNSEAVERALTELRFAVASVKGSAERYAEELIATVNRPSRDFGLSNKNSLIINSNYNKKIIFENIKKY